MAKWGEGDPRWIVEERPDATNVNNWHWTEKNATSWSKDRFLKLFENVVIGDENIECTIDKVDKCSGEATANNRKGKLIYFYEWQLVLVWKGHFLKPNSCFHTGKISIPNLSEEHDVKDIEITVTIDKSNDDSEVLKEFMYNHGREHVRRLLDAYITELKEEYSKNLILPVKKDENKCEKVINSSVHSIHKQPESYVTSVPSTGCKLDERAIYIKEDFHCSANDLYNVLIKQEMVEAFTRGPAKVDAIPGGQFALYGGHVHGFFDELVPNKIIRLRWRLKSWPKEHYSKVEIEFNELKNSTQMKLTQSGVPASEYDAIRANWYRYYWRSIKHTFGFGVALVDAL